MDYPGGPYGRWAADYPRGLGYPTAYGAVGALDYPGGLGYTRIFGGLYFGTQLSYRVGCVIGDWVILVD